MPMYVFNKMSIKFGEITFEISYDSSEEKPYSVVHNDNYEFLEKFGLKFNKYFKTKLAAEKHLVEALKKFSKKLNQNLSEYEEN